MIKVFYYIVLAFLKNIKTSSLTDDKLSESVIGRNFKYLTKITFLRKKTKFKTLILTYLCLIICQIITQGTFNIQEFLSVFTFIFKVTLGSGLEFYISKWHLNTLICNFIHSTNTYRTPSMGQTVYYVMRYKSIIYPKTSS